VNVKCSEAVELFIAWVIAVRAVTCEFACTDRRTDILFGGPGAFVVVDGDDGDVVVGLFGKV
jgi:hypothetical protein